MRLSADGICLGASLASAQPGAELWPGEQPWAATALRAVTASLGEETHYLVAIDRDGVAHPLAGTLPRQIIDPRLLEALESPHLWRTISPRRRYTCPELRGQVAAWPREPGLGGLFIKDREGPLGALLLAGDAGRSDPDRGGRASPQAGPTPSAENQAAHHLLEMILRHWRLSREGEALRAFARALVAAQRGGVLAIDGQGRVTYLSPHGEEILGITATEALGADCARILRPSVDENHPLLQGLGGKLEQVELYVTNRQGRDLPVSLSMHPILGPQGEPRGLTCAFRDLTEERALDEAARRHERLAVIGQLAAGAAHEIRNPLTGIGNCAQVLQMRLAGQEGNRKMADLILQEAQRLERIITSLLGFARPGQPRLRETRVEEVVHAALELDQPVYEQKGVRCEMRVAGMIPPIYIDPEQIRQVLANLLRNGVDAMPGGGLLSVEVSVVRRRLHMRRKLGRRSTDRVHVPSQGPQMRFVRIRVKDTGKGILPKILPRIFDPFFTTRSEGTGLGLSVSQSIVQEHGGFISVQSVQGKGTAFEVDLPVERRQGERREASRS